jgi:tRNA(adenine34) deaminase
VKDQIWNMNIALEQAEKAYSAGEVPVGCVVVDEFGSELAKSFNEKEKKFDPCGHAEIIAIRAAGQKLKNWRLSNCKIFVTLEPCPMCLDAMIHARVSHLIFGAYDSKAGALSLGYNFYKDKRLNHQFSVTGGIEHFKCSRLLSNFFRERRNQYQTRNDD